MPVLTDTLNDDIKRLTTTIEGLTRKVEENNKDFHGFQVEIIKQLGDINTKLGSVGTTLKIGGGLLTVAVAVCLTFGRSAVQTLWSAAEREGSIQTKIDMLESKLNEHIKNVTQPTSYRTPGPVLDEPIPDGVPKSSIDPTVPSNVSPGSSDSPSELKPIKDSVPKSRVANPPSSPGPSAVKPPGG